MTARTGVNGIVKSATNFMAQVPGGERLVLQAVKDMMDELRRLRRDKAMLEKRNQQLQARIERMQGAQAHRKAG